MAADNATLIADTLAAFNRCAKQEVDNEWVRPYDNSASPADANQALVFLKPEATADYAGVNVEEVLKVAVNALTAAGVTINAVRVLGGAFLEARNIMSEHYGVIAKISREGRSAISAQAEAKLTEALADELAAGARVLGGHEFLAENENFNAYSLCVLNDNVGTTRLAGGTYAMSCKVMGEPLILLNPFHAYQLVPFTTPGHCLIAFETTSSVAWTDLRDNLAGATDPKEAVEGSIRNLFLVNREALGLGDVDKGTNGLHMSAGPLEGMVELQRFMQDEGPIPAESTCFGRLLAEKGLTAEQIAAAAENPNVDIGGENQSTFDGTELMDAGAAADALKEAMA